jgi:hypothetical protein
LAEWTIALWRERLRRTTLRLRDRSSKERGWFDDVQRERSLFEVLLPDGHKLWPDWLRRIDTVLEDETVLEVVVQALEARWPQSRLRGRPGTLADVVIRMLILKHLFDWSYDDLEQEIRANLVYRAFTRIDAGEVPDAKTILKIAGALGPDVIAQLHRQVVEVTKRAGVTRGRCFRIDTTVVETNVHYPTDSTLLRDGVRVLNRTMQRPSTALGDEPRRIRNRMRSVTRGVLRIGYEARSPKTREPIRILIRERPEEHGIGDHEDRRVGAHCQRQCDDGHEGKAGGVPKPLPRERQVVQHVLCAVMIAGSARVPMPMQEVSAARRRDFREPSVQT